MMNESETIQNVLNMPREMRVLLVDRLIESLEYDDDFGVPQAVIDDCLRISEAIRTREMSTHTWEDIKADLEARRRA